MSGKSLFHLITLIYYLFTIWYDQVYIDIPLMKHPKDMKFFRGRLKYLTIWDMLLQTFFFGICVLNDLIGTNETQPKNPPLIRKFKDTLLTCLAFPLSMFVGLTFWGIYMIDRELIFPKALDALFPTWLNHAMHTNIMLFVLIELYTSFRQYPKRKLGLTVLSGFMLMYLIWIHFMYYHAGAWVYPILDVLNFPLRLVFFATLFVLCTGTYILGEKLNNFIWSRQVKVIKKRS